MLSISRWTTSKNIDEILSPKSSFYKISKELVSLIADVYTYNTKSKTPKGNMQHCSLVRNVYRLRMLVALRLGLAG